MFSRQVSQGPPGNWEGSVQAVIEKSEMQVNSQSSGIITPSTHTITKLATGTGWGGSCPMLCFGDPWHPPALGSGLCAWEQGRDLSSDSSGCFLTVLLSWA